MRRRQVIVDTGPLVALLNRRDRHHAWAKERFAELEPPLLTCEAVIAESCYLLRNLPGGCTAVLKMIARGIIEVPFRLAPNAEALGALLDRYASVPMSLADATLVLLAGQLPESAVFTLDGDFSSYRRRGNERIPLVIPASGKGQA